MKLSVYDPIEIKQLIDQMLGIYDLVRLVDPDECRVLELDEKGRYKPSKECYTVWSTKQRCANCSSYKACHSETRVEKNEYFQNKTFHILSVPLEISNPDGINNRCVMECITIREGIDESVDLTRDGIISTEESMLLDSLTGVYNSDGFYKFVRQSILNEPDSEWAIIIYDVVKFKMINDIFGRDKGNAVLIRFADILRNKLIDNEVCGRLKGDRFALLIHADRFNDGFVISDHQEFSGLINENLFKMNVQAGVYFVTNKLMPIPSMCDRALIALGTIKNDITHHVSIFNENMLEKMIKEQHIIDECEKAIAEGEFQIYLQPQVEEDGKIAGAEALARWIRPNGEIVPPREFISILEKSDLIVKLDTCIWEQAARKLRDWKDSDKKDLYISVNISPKDFFHIDVYDFFEKLVKKYDIDKSKLKLEITETLMMNDAIKQLALVNKLHENGFEIEIDDFGKGFSSLSLLKDLSADTLKIDMEFLRETDNSKKSESILGSVISMSDSLDMNVITEGIETKDQFDRMIRLGCHSFQGFYFARPMPVESFEELFENNKGIIV